MTSHNNALENDQILPHLSGNCCCCIFSIRA